MYACVPFSQASAVAEKLIQITAPIIKLHPNLFIVASLFGYSKQFQDTGGGGASCQKDVKNPSIFHEAQGAAYIDFTGPACENQTPFSGR
jgi:hypothetical protein